MATNFYEIRVAGTLGTAAREALADVAVEVERTSAVLVGSLTPDELHALLDRVRALGLDIVEVNQTPDTTPGKAGRGPTVREAGGALVRHGTFTLVLLTGCYYTVPRGAPWHDGVSAVRFAGATVLFAAFLLLLRTELRMVRRRYPPRWRQIQLLLTAFYLLVLAFAAVYFVIALNATRQFEGIANRTDALYFAVSTVATVGYGDVHATGTAARALVTVQMMFDLIYVGAAVRLLGVAQTRRAGGD